MHLLSWVLWPTRGSIKLWQSSCQGNCAGDMARHWLPFHVREPLDNKDKRILTKIGWKKTYHWRMVTRRDTGVARMKKERRRPNQARKKEWSTGIHLACTVFAAKVNWTFLVMQIWEAKKMCTLLLSGSNTTWDTYHTMMSLYHPKLLHWYVKIWSGYVQAKLQRRSSQLNHQ